MCNFATHNEGMVLGVSVTAVTYSALLAKITTELLNGTLQVYGLY